MPEITQFAQALGELFALVATLAVLVTGFFVGRHWLRKISRDTDSGGAPFNPTRNYSDYKSMRADGWTPQEISRGGKGDF